MFVCFEYFFRFTDVLDGHTMDVEVSGRCLHLIWMFSDKFGMVLG